MKRLFCGLFILAATTVLIPRLSGEEKRPEPEEKIDIAPVVKGSNTFALELYAKLAKSDEPVFFSPYSISTALAMTYAGARGQTAVEMAKVLHFPEDAAQLHPAYAALIKKTRSASGVQLTTSNALWADGGYGFARDFLELPVRYYGAGIYAEDFAADPEGARRRINAWVEKQTQRKITDLLPKGALDDLTRLVLTNAIYFKGDWQEPFKKGATRDEPFFLTPEETVQVPLMNQTEVFGYAKGDGFQVLEMPYEGRELALVALLPTKKDGLGEFERSLTAENLAKWLRELRRQPVQVTLPKFRMEAQFELKKPLSDLGMPLAFSSEADFTGMSRSKGKELRINTVTHKAVVEVNEKGTEAAAATAVEAKVKEEANDDKPQPPPVFRADHPFVFLVRDRRTDSVLFLGRVTNPK
jgi:serpin B